MNIIHLVQKYYKNFLYAQKNGKIERQNARIVCERVACFMSIKINICRLLFLLKCVYVPWL